VWLSWSSSVTKKSDDAVMFVVYGGGVRLWLFAGGPAPAIFEPAKDVYVAVERRGAG